MDNLISVIMCTYNESEGELRHAIESALIQTHRTLELLIVLDNPDNLMIRRVVHEYAAKDDRIRIIANEKNLGVAESTNIAWKQAKGKYIAKLDADDVAMPQRLEIEFCELKRKGLDLVAASKRNVNEDGVDVGLFVNNLNPSQMEKLLPYDNLITQSTVLMRKQVLVELGGYINLPSCEDYDLWLRMLSCGYKMGIMPDILVDYRVRSNSITRSDYYKQYLSDKFVRKMYKKYSGTNKVWSLDDYQKYITDIKPTEEKKQRFNEAYRMYYTGMEARKVGNYAGCLAAVIGTFFHNPRILEVFLRKVLFHLRKKIYA